MRAWTRPAPRRAAAAGALAWAGGLAAAAAVVAAIVLSRPVRRRPRPSRRRRGGRSAEPEIAVSDEALERMERTMARERTARYLDEAQDVLVTVSGAPRALRPQDRSTSTWATRRARSRELLARRALLVDLDGSAALAARARARRRGEDAARGGVARGLRAAAATWRPSIASVERERLLMKMDLMTRELRGMSALARAAPCCGLALPPLAPRAGRARPGRGAAAHGQGAVLRRQVRRGAAGLGAVRAAARGRGRRGRRCTGSRAAARSWASTSARCASTRPSWPRAPRTATLVEEARTSRVGLAARLYKAGQQAARRRSCSEALADPSSTVRYYAALQLAGLGPEMARARGAGAAGDRARRRRTTTSWSGRSWPCCGVDPAALTGVPDDRGRASARRAAPRARRAGSRCASPRRARAAPKVSITMPFALAELVFKSLPDEALRELRSEGLRRGELLAEARASMGPTEVIDIEGDDGERIQIWIE